MAIFNKKFFLHPKTIDKIYKFNLSRIYRLNNKSVFYVNNSLPGGTE
ncbi:hypothetical protein ykris0001_42450 [Yersinia kristensenii ATCC 33638]|nr:hypothetical protein ykris0001_42450 [Yersinia kristensenii ATCC 33638]